MPKRKILVVEDHLINREILANILSDEYTVLEAGNGEEALNILYKDKGAVSLILLDLIMPVMDGFTFLDRIREDALLSQIPIIVTTQSSGEKDEIAALSHGATDFLPKPYRPEIVRHRITNLIALRENAALANKLRRDSVTGLYEKMYFCRAVRKELTANPDGNYTIISINIENFRLYNDIYGFPAGDALLKVIANAADGVVGDRGFCSRFNADRFFCFLREDIREENFTEVIEKMKEEESGEISGVMLHYGVYGITDVTLPIEVMCDRATLAVNSVKGRYDRIYSVYDDSMLLSQIRKKALTDSMAEAVEQGQFEVYFQPKYSLKDNRMSGAEALVRWNHPTLGIVSPGEFIPLFEENGFITELDKFVWKNVCFHLHTWQENGVPLFPVSINVSRADVYRIPLAQTIQELSEKYELKPSYLRVEITESAYSDHPEQIRCAVNELRAFGFSVDMDDFGSGYSSLTMFGQVNVDSLKLDTGFIRNEMAKSRDRSLITDVVKMAHRFHLSVVAEGVETLEQMQKLQAVGCDYVQGYLFARPMPAAEYEKLCRAQVFVPPSQKTELPSEFSESRRVIIVADENAEYREKIISELEPKFETAEASDEKQALSLVNRYGHDRICGVVLSASLPDNTAEFFLRAMRSDPSLWAVPVLVTVPFGKAGERSYVISASDDYICKHHPADDIARKMRTLVLAIEGRRREDDLKAEAQTDLLTGLRNRRGLVSAVNHIKTDELPFAVLAFEVDTSACENGFAKFLQNDGYMIEFSDFLRKNTSRGDILGRFEGNRFFAVLKGIGDKETVLAEGSRICESFNSREKSGNEKGAVVCTGGAVLCSDATLLSERLFEMADSALGDAKRSRKGSCTVWSGK